MASLGEGDIHYHGWRVVAASSASLFFASFIVYTFGVFFKPLAAEFGWSRETVSTAYSVMALTAAASAPMYGYLLDRTNVRRLVLPCMAMLGVAFASLSLMTSERWQFFATFTVLGLVGTALSPVGYTRVVSTWFERRRGLALGLLISGAAIAAVAQPPATQALINALGWRMSYVVIGAAMLTVGLPIAFFFIHERPVERSASTSPAPGAPLAQALRSRVFWTLVVVFFAAAVALNGAIVHLSALLTDRGVSSERAALVISVMGAASLAGRLSTGLMLDYLFGARVSFMLLTIAALGTYLLASADSFASGAVAAALIGFGMGGELDVTPYLISRYFGLRAFSRLYGLAYAASALAGAVGPILLGRVFDSTGSYADLLPKIALFMVTAAVLMLTLPKYELRTQTQGVRQAIPGPVASGEPKTR